jgi:ABC-type bacteriocin/lantibiotic exporter with double-glycine peptidase domain
VVCPHFAHFARLSPFRSPFRSRQRISLARALLKDPPILVLDEATAMFDPDGEAAFIEECRAVLQTRTVILITHRPASLALADRVLRVERGRVRDAEVPAIAPALGGLVRRPRRR